MVVETLLGLEQDPCSWLALLESAALSVNLGQAVNKTIAANIQGLQFQYVSEDLEVTACLQAFVLEALMP
ncbi:MAG: hypothetical protein HRU20_13265 [Pseudomonadales bacterium]|nr:hypothetical protein [Pseudomonadales bacterium]